MSRPPGSPQRLVCLESTASEDKLTPAVPSELRQRRARGFSLGKTALRGTASDRWAACSGLPLQREDCGSQPASSGAAGESFAEVHPGQLPRAWPAGVVEPTEAGFLRQRSKPEMVG